jgi:hypothetical protein
MGKAIKQISILTLVLSLNLVWVNSSFADIAFFNNQLCISGECQDSSDFLEYCHTFCSEDDVSMCYSKVQSNIFTTEKEKVPAFTGNFDNNYLNNIWQPPKLS